MDTLGALEHDLDVLRAVWSGALPGRPNLDLDKAMEIYSSIEALGEAAKRKREERRAKPRSAETGGTAQRHKLQRG